MSASILELLEFDMVREILARYAVTAAGKQRAADVRPLDDDEAVRYALKETAEMADVLARRFTLPLGALEDVTAQARRARAAGAPLEAPVFIKIAECLDTAGRIARSLQNMGHDHPSLVKLGFSIPECPELAERIRRTVDPNGSVLDSASHELRALRRRIRTQRRRIESVLQKMVERSDVRPHLQYANPTVFRDRYVLPVNAYRKNEVRGIVHGSSDSGATLYVEPMQVVEAGNGLAAALGEEQEEVERVLWELTRAVGAECDAVVAVVDRLAHVDLLRAKGLMSNAFRMCSPKIARGRTLVLKEARHPVLTYMTRPELASASQAEQLDFDSVVPLDVHVGDDFRMLVITGPNTGGKTVALKVIGLLCLMARSGMNVPAAQATIPLYDQIFADIGDEQSLEQSLSTFSGHMSRIIRILREATPDSLVLLDELGAGTDPAEGAALGEAVLLRLSEIGCCAVVVTHLGRLKTFSACHPSVESASMEFDLTTLRPTYRLLMGTVGSSNALQIAERLGLGQDILSRARGLLDKESNDEYTGVLEQVTLAREDAEQRRDRMRYLEEEAGRLKTEYEAMLVRLKAEEERRGADVGLKFRERLRALHDSADSVYEELRHTHRTAARRVRGMRDELAACLEEISKLLHGHGLDRPLQTGDEVYVIKIHKWGTVDRVDRRGRRVKVSVDGRQIDVNVADLQPWGHDV